MLDFFTTDGAEWAIQILYLFRMNEALLRSTSKPVIADRLRVFFARSPAIKASAMFPVPKIPSFMPPTITQVVGGGKDNLEPIR